MRKFKIAAHYALLTLLLLLAACASAGLPTNPVEIPTLMLLPTETETLALGITPSNTRLPTVTPTFTDIPPPTSTPPPTALPTRDCPTDAWWDAIEPLIIEFFDTAEVASSTSRASLAPIILELQRTWRAFERIEVPDCQNAPEVALELNFGMDFAVRGYNAFLANAELDSEVFFTAANQAIYNAYLAGSADIFLVDRRVTSSQFIWGGRMPNEATATSMAQATYATRTIPPRAEITRMRLTGTIVSAESAPVRDCAITSCNVITRLAMGTQVRILSFVNDSSWIQVELEDGRRRWVSATLIRINPIDQR